MAPGQPNGLLTSDAARMCAGLRKVLTSAPSTSLICRVTNGGISLQDINMRISKPRRCGMAGCRLPRHRMQGFSCSRSVTYVPQTLEVLDRLLIQQLVQQRVVETACVMKHGF